jgi:hypothetical protein
MDSRRSPQRVDDAHLADQPANFQRHSRSAAASRRFPAPIRSEARAGPSYNSVRPNDRKRTTGLREQPVTTNENQSVNWGESELARRPSPKHIDLLPQYQNLGLKRSSRPEKIREHPPDQSAQVPHRATASPDSQSTTSRIWFAVGTGHDSSPSLRSFGPTSSLSNGVALRDDNGGTIAAYLDEIHALNVRLYIRRTDRLNSTNRPSYVEKYSVGGEVREDLLDRHRHLDHYVDEQRFRA